MRSTKPSPHQIVPAANFFSISKSDKNFKDLTKAEQRAAVEGALGTMGIKLTKTKFANQFIPLLLASQDQTNAVLLGLLQRQLQLIQAAASGGNEATTANLTAVQVPAIKVANSGTMIVAPKAYVAPEAAVVESDKRSATPPQLLRGATPEPITAPTPEFVHQPGQFLEVPGKRDDKNNKPVTTATKAKSSTTSRNCSVFGVIGAAVKAGCAIAYAGMAVMAVECLTKVSLGLTSALSSFLQTQSLAHYAYAYDMRASTALHSASVWLTDPNKEAERMAVSVAVVVIGASALALKCYSSRSKAEQSAALLTTGHSAASLKITVEPCL